MEGIKKSRFSLLIVVFFLLGTAAYATTCSNGDCTTTVHQHENHWEMLISCEDGSTWTGGGDGQWGGTACNQQ